MLSGVFFCVSILGARVIATSTIRSAFTGRDNRFTPIRFVLASMVMLEHVFVVIRGPELSPLIAANGWSAGYLAVNGFFILSGFLIADSLERRSNAKAFAIARFLRIMPALAVLALLATLVIGPLVTGLPQAQYWSSTTTWLYPINVLAFADTSGGPAGIFTGNPAEGEFSATLWTLRYEVLAYAAAGLIFFTRLAWGRWPILGLFIAGTAVYLAIRLFWPDAPAMITHGGRFGSVFLLGMVIQQFRDRLPVTILPVIILLPIAILMGDHALSELFWNGVLAVLIFWAGFAALDRLPSGARIPDWSYGIYIWHYPVMQSLWHFDVARSPLELAAYGIPLSLAVAAASWHLIERPALGLKFKLGG